MYTKEGNKMENELENALIKKAKAGNMTAFERLIISYEQSVYNIAYRMFNNEEDAKDMSQEVFIKVYKNIAKFDENSKFYTWLHRITVNTCIDEIRRRKGKETNSIDDIVEMDEGNLKKQYQSDSKTPEDKLISKENIENIKAAISSLSENHKMLIILRDIQGLSYLEISEITGISLGTVKSRLARARVHLKDIIINSMELSKAEKRLKDIDSERGV